MGHDDRKSRYEAMPSQFSQLNYGNLFLWVKCRKQVARWCVMKSHDKFGGTRDLVLGLSILNLRTVVFGFLPLDNRIYFVGSCFKQCPGSFAGINGVLGDLIFNRLMTPFWTAWFPSFLV